MGTRKALVVGIDHYENLSRLYGCVNDAQAVTRVLERDGDDRADPNFAVQLMTGGGADNRITKKHLRESVRALFSDQHDIALFYFAGHGHAESTGGYLCGTDSETGDDGLALADVLTLANKSTSTNRIIILDSCYSGAAGENPLTPQSSELTDGLTILTAATTTQRASEANGRGVFTTLFVDALEGAAANLVGQVTPGSVYAHIDQSLGPWEQRPVFKTNVKSFVSLRRVQPPVGLADLRRIAEFFPSAGFEFRLDPSFEPERGSESPTTIPPDPANTRRFALLQKFNRVNLVVPVDAPHMWHAAIQGKSCKLTALGEHYRRLVMSNRI